MNMVLVTVKVRICETISCAKLPQDFCRHATWKNRRNACCLSRFYRVAWRQKDKARCASYCFTDPKVWRSLKYLKKRGIGINEK